MHVYIGSLFSPLCSSFQGCFSSGIYSIFQRQFKVLLNFTWPRWRRNNRTRPTDESNALHSALHSIPFHSSRLHCNWNGCSAVRISKLAIWDLSRWWLTQTRDQLNDNNDNTFISDIKTWIWQMSNLQTTTEDIYFQCVFLSWLKTTRKNSIFQNFWFLRKTDRSQNRSMNAMSSGLWSE